MKNSKFRIFIVLLAFNGTINSIQAQMDLPENEYKKLTNFVVKAINGDELRERVFNQPSCLIMVGIHLNEKKRIDSISVQSSDSIVASTMKKMSYDQLLVYWDFLIPEADAKALISKPVTFYWPILITNESYDTDKTIFSKKDIEAIFFKDSFAKSLANSLNYTILLKPINIGVKSYPPTI